MLAPKEQLFSKSERLSDRVLMMCDELAVYLSAQYDQPILGQHDSFDARAYLQGLPEGEQQAIFESLVNYYSLMIDGISAGIDLKSTSNSVRHSLAWSKFDLNNEIFLSIKDNTVIEFFDMSLRQIWRSNNFFKVSSHSLAALFCRPFHLNFKKDPVDIEETIKGTLGALFTGKVEYCKDVAFEHHIIEVDSPKTMVMTANIDYVSLLYKNGTPFGVASAIEVKRSQPALSGRA